MRCLSKLYSEMGVCGSYSIKHIIVRNCRYPVLNQEGEVITSIVKTGIYPVIHIAKCSTALIYRRTASTTLTFSFSNPSPINWVPVAWADRDIDISKLPINPCPHHQEPFQKGQKDLINHSEEPFCGRRELVRRFLFVPTDHYVIDGEGRLGRIERRWLEWAYIVRQAVCERDLFDVSFYYSELPMTWEAKWIDIGFALEQKDLHHSQTLDQVLTSFPCRYHLTPTWVEGEDA